MSLVLKRSGMGSGDSEREDGTVAAMGGSEAIVGRDAELGRLESCLSGLRSRRGGLVTVTGPAGIGKSHLLRHWVATASSCGAVVATATLERMSPRPYEVWRLISKDLSEQGFRPPPGLPEAYRGALDLQAVGGRVDAGAAAALPRLPAEQARYRVYDAVRLLLASVADERPLVVVVDDLQLADGPSVKLLRHLLPFAAPMALLIVVAFDDEDPSSTELAHLRGAIPDQLPHEHLRLTGVSGGAVREILEESGPGGTPPAVVHEIGGAHARCTAACSAAGPAGRCRHRRRRLGRQRSGTGWSEACRNQCPAKLRASRCDAPVRSGPVRGTSCRNRFGPGRSRRAGICFRPGRGGRAGGI